MGFKDELIDFNEKCSSANYRDDAEINEEDIIKALVILNFMEYKKVPDLFLACAAMNLLNTYSKRKDSKLGYNYKRHMQEIIKGIETVGQPKTILIGYDNTNNMQLLIVQFWNFQFSFQAQRLSSAVQKLISNKKIEWDGIRKQPISKMIFECAYSRSWLSNSTLLGADLHLFVDNELRNYDAGDYKFSNGKLRKTGGIKYTPDTTDRYLKNYMRVRLLSCTDRPVILSGIFRKIWDKHITFTSVRPYIQGIKTITICDHINLKRTDVESVINLNDLKQGKRYYIIGYCEKYPRNDRMGVRLAVENTFVPIFEIGDYKLFPKDALAICHRFGIEENIREDQTAYTL